MHEHLIIGIFREIWLIDSFRVIPLSSEKMKVTIHLMKPLLNAEIIQIGVLTALSNYFMIYFL